MRKMNPWAEAAILLDENPAALVKCPECEKDYLCIQDIRGGDVVEREIKCQLCGARNFLRMVRPLDSSE